MPKRKRAEEAAGPGPQIRSGGPGPVRPGAATWVVDQTLPCFDVASSITTLVPRVVALSRMAGRQEGTAELIARAQVAIGEALVQGVVTESLRAAEAALAELLEPLAPRDLVELLADSSRLRISHRWVSVDEGIFDMAEREYAAAQILSSGEATALWRLSESTLRQAIRRKRLAAERSGKVWLVHTGDVVRLYGAPWPVLIPEAGRRYIFAWEVVTLLGQVPGYPDRVVLQREGGGAILVLSWPVFRQLTVAEEP